jgi:transposase
MMVLHPRCAGLDIGKKIVVCCVRVATGDQVTTTVRTFSTTTKGLLAMHEWLSQNQCTHVAMEATGVYWKPIWHVLEGDFELVLANAQHIKNVPGRKSDVNDATWIAELMAHGLIRSSFVPPPAIQELRQLTRTRRQLVQEQTRHVQRIDKLLQDMQLKLGSVLSEVMGRSGRDILEALVKGPCGPTDPVKLAKLANKRVKATAEELQDALRGQVSRVHQVLLQQHLSLYDGLDRAIQALEAELTERLRPFRRSYDLLLTIPGVGDTVAQTIVAEVGVDMSRFPTAGHLLSWAGLCPDLNESAGKRKSTRLRKGAPWLKSVLMQAAWSVIKVKKSYLRAQFLRLKSHMNANKAIAAVAASLLKAVYYMLRDGVPYKDLGADYFDQRKPKVKLLRLIKQIENLGLKVQIDPAAKDAIRVTAVAA